jgi:hypothetical protein
VQGFPCLYRVSLFAPPVLAVGEYAETGSANDFRIRRSRVFATLSECLGTLVLSFASFRRTKMPRRVRAASITSDPMPGDLEHTLVPIGLAYRG